MEQDLCFSSSKAPPCPGCSPWGRQVSLECPGWMAEPGLIHHVRTELCRHWLNTVAWVYFLNPLLGWRKALLWLLRWFNWFCSSVCFAQPLITCLVLEVTAPPFAFDSSNDYFASHRAVNGYFSYQWYSFFLFFKVGFISPYRGWISSELNFNRYLEN